jgi:hypothetical protein
LLTQYRGQLIEHTSDKQASGTTFEDALTLAQLKRLQPATNAFNEFVDVAMG